MRLAVRVRRRRIFFFFQFVEISFADLIERSISCIAGYLPEKSPQNCIFPAEKIRRDRECEQFGVLFFVQNTEFQKSTGNFLTLGL